MTDLFFAEVVDYAGLRTAIRARVEQLGISRTCLDDVAGLPTGYSGKLLAPKAPKKIGRLSLELMLRAAGLKLLVVDDREALAKVQPMYEQRHTSSVRTDNHWRNRRAIAAEGPSAV